MFNFIYKTFFLPKVGSKWKLKIDNPFVTDTTIVTIKEVKENYLNTYYVKYGFNDEPTYDGILKLEDFYFLFIPLKS